jgi:hypothetical protein
MLSWHANGGKLLLEVTWKRWDPEFLTFCKIKSTSSRIRGPKTVERGSDGMICCRDLVIEVGTHLRES